MKKEYLLINSDFEPKEGGYLLSSLIQSKILFHSCNSLSELERLGKEVSGHTKRIKQLKALNTKLSKDITSAVKMQKKIRVKGNISIEFI